MLGLKRLTVLGLAVFLMQPAWSTGFSYRYRDNTGVTHIGYSVPPQFVEYGYEILNDQGRVIEVVLPKKVLDERARESLLEEQKRQDLAMQHEKDQALLRFYSSVEDVERVRDRKLTEFDNFIEIQKANILSYKKRVAKLQSQAADLERMNRPVPKDILKNLATLEQKIGDAEEAIVIKGKERDQVAQAYAADIERLSYLLHDGEETESPE